ncbi:MAG: glycosyltransferase [Rhizobiaceae bacterium]
MLSVIIQTRDNEAELARTLATLVGAAVEGLVREVIVCDTGSRDATLKVADHAGCRMVSDGIGEAVRTAKGEWLLLLEPGARLVDGWIDPVVAHLTRQTMPARFTRTRSSRPRFLARVFSTVLAEGLLIRKAQAASRLRPGVDAESIGRGLASRRIAAGITPAEGR